MNWYKKSNYDNNLYESIKNKTKWKDREALRLNPYRKSRDSFYQRGKFVNEYSWAIPEETAIKKIKSFVKGRNVLEIGSGLGLWAKLMQNAGIHVTPTEPLSMPKKDKGDFYGKKEPYTKMNDMDINKAMEQFGSSNDVLMLIWPPYNDPLANNALKSFKGSSLIYIGEGSYGCTGDDNFHCALDNEWEEVEEVDIPQWAGLHDRMYFYNRK